MKPMINPYKHRPLARLCIITLITNRPESWDQAGHGKARERGRSRSTTGNFREQNSWTNRAAVLRRCTEEKLARPATIAGHHLHQKATPLYLRPQAKSRKVGRRFLPGPGSMRGAYAVQMVKLPQNPMPTTKPPERSYQPTSNQPRGNQTLRVHLLRSAMKASLSHLPTPHPQKQRPDHSTQRVLKVRN